MKGTRHLELVRAAEADGHATHTPTPRTTTVVPATPLAETAETCARQVDELAAQAEHAIRQGAALLNALGDGEVITAARHAFGQHAVLRSLAASLGELHTVLDEMAHQGPTGGAS